MSIDRDAALQLLLCHTLGRAATIQLHKNFKHMDGLTESKDVVASKAASAALDGVDFAQLAFVDPIFAILWSITARALINEMARLRALSIGGEHALYVRGEHHKVATSLTKVTNAMSIRLLRLADSMINDTLRRMYRPLPLPTIETWGQDVDCSV
ncbi:predicted protein [Postia placenta Mad-698-R]|nr:predicted protein [Postia placenta Mad-698-R]